MTPPISKDWWAAAAALAGTVPAAMGQVPPAPPPTSRQQAGIVTTAAPQAPSGIQVAPLFVDTASNQRLVNNTTGPMHVLFSDQSALTLAPGAEVMIAQYRFQPDQGTGNIAINLLKGILRVVGGKISKTNPVQVRTSTATIGIRGGISIVEFKPDGETDAKFLFGQDLTFTLDGGSRSAAGTSGLGGPDYVNSGLTDEQFRTAGWFTDGGDVGGGGSGDVVEGSGQSDAGLVSQIRAILTKPGWSAAAGGAGLLTQIETKAYTTATLQRAIDILSQSVNDRGAFFQESAVIRAGAGLIEIPAPTPPPPAVANNQADTSQTKTAQNSLSTILGRLGSNVS
ncbi:MAG: hypothetical protein EAZ37_09130 [Burkholderiales bacterium]|nr:MAG: hypothetical protein EAZ37_09130 [Burkholderiales bacterium]